MSCLALGQIAPYPSPMDSMGMEGSPSYPSEMMGYPAPCDGACDSYDPGMGGCESEMGGRYLGMGRGDHGGLLSRLDNRCGGGGFLSNGCGPLGCNGGTFGDGRSLSSLFSALAGRLCSLTGLILKPYGEGGVAAQRWFDLSAEAIVLSRTQGAASRNFSSLGLTPNNPTAFVLNSNQVNLDRYRAGLALQSNIQVGPGSNVEVVYFGLNKWRDSATVTSAAPGTLFSFLSDFGTNPSNGFDDPDRSLSHTISYESSLHNGEVNLRRRWAEPSGFLQGSFLCGIRYFQLDEQFDFTAVGNNTNSSSQTGPRFFNYETETKNQLTGFQVGADLWLNLIPGVKVGSELKGGVFGNHATQNTRITANSLPAFGIPAIDERASDGRTAYLVQLSNQVVYRLTYAWTLRGSHQLIYVDNVALAPDNVNDEPPGLFLPNSTRTVGINTDANILYTGFTSGVEYTW